jgi:hypothetical protein
LTQLILIRIGYISSRSSVTPGPITTGVSRSTQKANLSLHFRRIARDQARFCAADAVECRRTTTASSPISARRSSWSCHFARQEYVPFHWLYAAGAWLIVSVIARSTSRVKTSPGCGAGGLSAGAGAWTGCRASTVRPASAAATARLPACPWRASTRWTAESSGAEPCSPRDRFGLASRCLVRPISRFDHTTPSGGKRAR